jgi:hypothetical protein
MALAIVLQVSWGRLVNRRCVPMGVPGMVVAMVSLESVSVMWVMVVLIVLSLCALIARTETVVTMLLASARLDGKVILVLTKHVMKVVTPMAGNAAMASVCAPLAL